MKIDIAKWDSFNPRNDAKAWSWFRMQNDFLEDEVVYELRAWQKCLLLYLFAKRNKAGGPFAISHKQAADYCDCTTDQVSEGLRVLAEKKKILLIEDKVDERPRTADVPDPNADVRERTDGGREPNVDVRSRTAPERERTDDEAIRSLRDETRRDKTRRKREKAATPSLPPPSPFDLELAADWAAFAKSRSDTLDPDLADYADAVRRLREVAGLGEDDIRQTLAFVKADEFWQDKALSPGQLFKRAKGKGTPRKLDNIRAQMAAASGGDLALETPLRPPQCHSCLDTGVHPGEGPDGTLESFRCDCEAGRASKVDRPLWDDDVAGATGWRRLKKQVSRDSRHL